VHRVNVALSPSPRKRVKFSLKEFEEFDAPKKGFKRLFHKVFHVLMRRKIEEMVAESNLEEGELRTFKRENELKRVRRRIFLNYFYLVLAPVCAVTSFKAGVDSWTSGSWWATMYFAFSIMWARALAKDWRSRKELLNRRMELLVEEVHDL
jgi:hypothetical protein